MAAPTALVTGASQGIGLEFCRALARRGFDLVLVARREAELQLVAAGLRERYGVECHVIPADLAMPDAAEALVQRLDAEGLQIDFLVNNAGLLFNGFFDELDLAPQEQLLAVNIVALTALTHRLLAPMVQRGHGTILNLASTAAWMALPNQNVYAASKAFVLSFTLGLADEQRARRSGVQVTALCPSFTNTRMLDNPEQGARLAVPKLMVLEPARVAEAGVRGALAGSSLVIPGWSNRLSMGLLQLLPRTWLAAVMGGAYRRGMAGER
ncbi:MAG: SDR family NAD(P)-dependent oxidoreductase [Microbacteriaceae bacterium]